MYGFRLYWTLTYLHLFIRLLDIILLIRIIFSNYYWIFGFAFLVVISIDIASSAVEICAITAGVKKCKLIIKKKKKKHDKIGLSVKKKKFSSIEDITSISMALIDSYISHNEFISVNNVLRKYDDMREEMEDLKTSTVHERF